MSDVALELTVTYKVTVETEAYLSENRFKAEAWIDYYPDSLVAWVYEREPTDIVRRFGPIDRWDNVEAQDAVGRLAHVALAMLNMAQAYTVEKEEQ